MINIIANATHHVRTAFTIDINMILLKIFSILLISLKSQYLVFKYNKSVKSLQ